MASIPPNDYDRLLRQLRRAMQGHTEAMARNSDTWRRALREPMAQLTENQAAIRDALQAPTRALEGQSAQIRRVLATSAARDWMHQQQAMRSAMQEPLRAIADNQRQIGAALRGPVASMLRNHAAIQEALQALAALPDEDLPDQDTTSSELDQEVHAVAMWVEGLAKALPTQEQASALVGYLTLLAAVLVWRTDLSGEPVAPEAQHAVAALLAALVVISRFLPKSKDGE